MRVTDNIGMVKIEKTKVQEIKKFHVLYFSIIKKK